MNNMNDTNNVNNPKNITEEMKAKHRRNKIILKIVAILLLLGALAFIITAIVSWATEGFLKNFWCLMVGLPMVGVGGMFAMMGFRKEIGSYMVNESAPLVNQYAKNVAPGITDMTQAVKQGWTGAVCPNCDSPVGSDQNFCNKCGASLTKQCPKCGNTVSQDSNFCDKCGTQL